MSDGKLSYERRRAQREAWGKIHEAEKIRQDRTSRALLLTLSASVLLAAGRAFVAGAEDIAGAVGLAGQIIDASERAATAAVPGVPGGPEDDADG